MQNFAIFDPRPTKSDRMKQLLFAFFTLLFTSSLFAQWTQVTAPPDWFRTDHSFGFALNGTGYLVTGQGPDSITAAFFSYDPALDVWTQLSDFPGGTRGYAIGDVLQDKAYFGFGRGMHPDSTEEVEKNDLWSYDPATDQWTELSACPCTPRNHPALVAHQGNIYVGMGSTPGIGNLNDWWQYNIASDTWTQKPDLPDHPRHHPYQFAVGDYVYTGFGHGNVDPEIYKTWYRFDPSDDTWTQVADIPDQGRVAGTQFSHNGYGYVLSGEGDTHESMLTGEFWRYDPDSNQWAQLEPHPGPSRWAPASFILDNEVYVLNGRAFGSYLVGSYKYDLGEPISSTSDPVGPIEMQLFPNPVSSQLTIRFDSDLIPAKAGLRILLIDMLGRTVQQETIYVSPAILDVNHLANGLYRVECYAGSIGVASGIMVKQAGE